MTQDLAALVAQVTPGPWWTDARYNGREMGCAIIAASTDCGPLPGNPTRGMVAWSSAILNTEARRCEANARLIAMAPDLAHKVLEQQAEIEAQAAEIARLNKQWENHDAAWSERVAALTAALAEANHSAIAKVAEATEARMKAEAALSECQAREAMLHRAITEASDPDFIWGAMDNVHDMDADLEEFAKAASRAIRAAVPTPADAQAALPAASQPESEPVAWQQRLASGGWGTILHGNDKPIGEARPLYTHPTPAPVVPAEGATQAAAEIRELVKCRCNEAYTSRGMHSPDCNYHYAEPAELLIAAALRAQQPAAPVSGVTVQDDASAFDRADWFWRTMDPDDCGDNPAEAINRAMVGQFVVCEIASSYNGPTRYGFIAPVLDLESDEDEFLHFSSQQEAIDAAKDRRLALSALEGK